MDIYDRINELLSQNHKTRKEMCEAINLPYSTYNSLYQRRTERIKFEIVQNIARYLNTTTDYLAFGKEKKAPSKETELLLVFNRLPDDKKSELIKYANYLLG
jgi:transcriptional regulator with XRE-family HTH domain